MQPKLTPREKEVFELILEEFSTTEIAKKLNISIRTVESHRQNIIKKKGCKNIVGMVKLGIVDKILNK